MSLLAVFGLALIQTAQRAPTYSKDIAPILNRRCVSCHSESRVAPFSLIGYRNAKQYAQTIVKVTESGYMPPWKAKLDYGEFRDVPVLTAREKSLIAQWARGGAQEGNPAEAPPPPVIAPGWRLGEPDMIVTPPKPTKIPAEGGDFYRDYLVDPHISKPTWIRAIDFRPRNKGDVHHVIPFIVSKEDAAKCRNIKLDHDDESWDQASLAPIDRGGTLGFWSTGAPPFESPAGTAFQIKPGDCLLLDLHYKTTGKPEVEKTQVGLYFLKDPPVNEMTTAVVESEDIYLQPGASEARVYTIGPKTRSTATVYAVWPHMHFLGRTFKAWVKYPSGYSKPFVAISDWDPDWQLLYYLRTPMVIPAGSKIYVTGTYDNSGKNPRNPHSPPTVVESGPSSKDEMLLMLLFEVVTKDPVTKSKPAGSGGP